VSTSVAAALLIYGVFDFPLLFAEPGKNAGAGTIKTTWICLSDRTSSAFTEIRWWSPTDSASLNFRRRISLAARETRSCADTQRRVLTGADVHTTVSIVGDADHGFLMMADTDATAMEGRSGSAVAGRVGR
jgi:hypothetical protein